MDGYTLSISTTVAISAANFLAGVLVGHWLAVRRDNQKEFNAIADPIAIKLAIDRGDPCPLSNAITGADEQLIARLLPRHRRAGFTSACAAYAKAKADHQEIGAFGVAMYPQTAEIVRHIDKLLGYLKRKKRKQKNRHAGMHGG